MISSYMFSSFVGRTVMVWVLLIIFLNAQNPENFKEEAANLVGKFYPSQKISKSTDLIQIFSPDPSKKLTFKLYYESSRLADGGVNIFPEHFTQFYDSRILRFIERDLLLILLNKGKAVAHENVKYTLKGKPASSASLYPRFEEGLLAKFTGFELKSVSNGAKKFYTAILTFDKETLEIIFPARVDLILGAGWEQLSDGLTALLTEGGTGDTAGSAEAYNKPPPVVTKVDAHRPGLYQDVYDTSFISGDSRFYFQKDSTGFHPVDEAREPVEHLNNILVAPQSEKLVSTSVALKIKCYGSRFAELNTGLDHLIRTLSRGRNIFIAFEEHKGRKLVDLFFPDRDLNYFHLLFFEVEAFSAAAIQNRTVKGWLYPYLRLDNLGDIDKEFDAQGKPKWRVPVGN